MTSPNRGGYADYDDPDFDSEWFDDEAYDRALEGGYEEEPAPPPPPKREPRQQAPSGPVRSPHRRSRRGPGLGLVLAIVGALLLGGGTLLLARGTGFGELGRRVGAAYTILIGGELPPREPEARLAPEASPDAADAAASPVQAPSEPTPPVVAVASAAGPGFTPGASDTPGLPLPGAEHPEAARPTPPAWVEAPQAVEPEQVPGPGVASPRAASPQVVAPAQQPGPGAARPAEPKGAVSPSRAPAAVPGRSPVPARPASPPPGRSPNLQPSRPSVTPAGAPRPGASAPTAAPKATARPLVMAPPADTPPPPPARLVVVTPPPAPPGAPRASLSFPQNVLTPNSAHVERLWAFSSAVRGMPGRIVVEGQSGYGRFAPGLAARRAQAVADLLKRNNPGAPYTIEVTVNRKPTAGAAGRRVDVWFVPSN